MNGPAEPTRVFVYGTLRPGGVFWFQALASRVASVSPTLRIGGISLVDGPNFPMAVRASGDQSEVSGVVGEVVDVPDELAPSVLADLDRIEGVPHLFQRIKLNGVWVYVASPQSPGVTGATVVASGDWFDVAPHARHAWEAQTGRNYLGV